jgi:hypothetical protein
MRHEIAETPGAAIWIRHRIGQNVVSRMNSVSTVTKSDFSNAARTLSSSVWVVMTCIKIALSQRKVHSISAAGPFVKPGRSSRVGPLFLARRAKTVEVRSSAMNRPRLPAGTPERTCMRWRMMRMKIA